jgi:hypothetical protein
MQGPFARTRLSSVQIPRLPQSAGQTTTTEQTPAPVAPAAASTAALAVIPCPNCNADLTTTSAYSFCSRCGFWRSGDEFLNQAEAPQQHGGGALSLLPESAWPMLFLGFSVLPICYYADRRLPPHSLDRALWCVAQCVIGLGIVFLAQIWAYFLLRRRGYPVGIFDILAPLNLWRRAVQALPETGGSLGLAASGCVCSLTAVLWIGGLSYWATYDTEQDMESYFADKKEAPLPDRQKLKEKVEKVAKVEPVKNVKPPVTPPTTPRTPTTTSTPRDPRPVEQCVVVGYIPGKDGEVSGLILATLRDGELSYAGTVTTGVNQKDAPDLQKKLAPLTSKNPLLKGLDVKSAVWVEPKVFCEVHQSGKDDKGQLVKPALKGVVEDEPSQPKK